VPQTLEPVGSNSSAIGIHWLSAALVSGGSAAPQVGQDHTGNGEVPGSVARSAARIACVAVDHREQVTGHATNGTAPKASSSRWICSSNPKGVKTSRMLSLKPSM